MSRVDADVYVLDAVSAGYGSQTVLHELHLQIAAAAHVALIGPNGAGKTTLLRLLAGDIQSSQGRILLQGDPLYCLSPRQRAQRIAYVPPALDLVAALTVRDFVGLGRTPHVGPWQRLCEKDHQAVSWAIQQMHLTAYADRYVHTLSEGERHRAMIALGLAQEPAILLLDEPTAHLDIRHAWGTMELIDQLHRECGCTIVQASHDLNIAAAFASQIVLMQGGRIVQQGTEQEVLTESVLSDVYGMPLRVTRTDTQVHIMPVRNRTACIKT